MDNLVHRGINRIRRLWTKPVGAMPLTTIASFLPTNPVVVEAGAHQGFDTMAMSKFCAQRQFTPLSPCHRYFMPCVCAHGIVLMSIAIPLR